MKKRKTILLTIIIILVILLIIWFLYSKGWLINKQNKNIPTTSGDIVTVVYTSMDTDGVIYEENMRIQFTVGDETIMPILNQTVLGMKVGDIREKNAKVKDAYGMYYDKTDIQKLLKAIFNEAYTNLEPGKTLSLGDNLEGTILSTDYDSVTVDMNPRYTKVDMNFVIELKDIQKLSNENKENH